MFHSTHRALFCSRYFFTHIFDFFSASFMSCGERQMREYRFHFHWSWRWRQRWILSLSVGITHRIIYIHVHSPHVHFQSKGRKFTHTSSVLNLFSRSRKNLELKSGKKKWHTNFFSSWNHRALFTIRPFRPRYCHICVIVFKWVSEVICLLFVSLLGTWYA